MKKFLSIVLFAGALAACKKDPPPPPCTDNGLPCATTEGKNTFGCKVNGVNWVAQAPFTIGGSAALTGEYIISDGGFYLHAVNENDDQTIYEYINLYGKNIYATGEHVMYLNSATKEGFFDLTGADCFQYYHDTLNKGSLSITYLNTAEYIIAGTFFMTLVNKTCTDSVMYVTDGRFDFKY